MSSASASKKTPVSEAIFWKTVQRKYSPLLDRSVRTPTSDNTSTFSNSRVDEMISLLKSKESKFQESVKAAPVFLFNSSDMAYDGQKFTLNLFEPRYKIMCQRIIEEKIAPFMLFVPNFVDYVPRPSDFSKLCLVKCMPNPFGQTYTMVAKALETRILEMVWSEPGTGGLWFATSTGYQEGSKTIWQGTVHQNFRGRLVRRNDWEYRPQARIASAMDLNTFRLPLIVDPDVYHRETWNALMGAGLPPTQQVQLAYGKQELAFVTVGINYPAGTAGVYVRRDCRALVEMCRMKDNHKLNQSKAAADATVTLLKSEIVTAAKQDYEEHEINSTISVQDIQELPALPITVSLLEIMVGVVELFQEDVYAETLHREDFLPPSSSSMAKIFNKVIVDAHLVIQPDVFFRNGMQKDPRASSPTAAALPLDARVRCIYHFNDKDSNLSETYGLSASVADNCRMSIPYVADRLGYRETDHLFSNLTAHVFNGSSVNFFCRCDDISLHLGQARRIVKTLCIHFNWSRARLLFIGASQEVSTSPLSCLPRAIIRHVASFLKASF